MTPLGEHLRELRTANGVTQKEMAASLGVSAAYLSALEHGQRGMPSYALLQRIVGYFNIIWDDAEHLHELANLSDPRVVVDTTGLSVQATELANLFAAKISRMNDEKMAELKTMIEDR